MPRIAQLADQLRADIAGRGLAVGDRYLTAAEAGTMLGVSATTANRALRRLAVEGVLERRPRAGAVISRVPDGAPLAALKRVHLLVPGAMFTAIQHLLAAFEDGIHRVVPHCEVLRRFAADDTGRDTGRWLQSLDSSAEGVVGVLTAAADQRSLAGSTVPVVVWGSVFPEAGRLPWVDADWRSNGEALAAHLVRLRRFPAALLMHTVWAYGDNLMLEGMLGQLARQAEVAPADLRVRSVGQTEEAVFEAVRTLLAQADAPRTCVLRSSFMLPPALAALREMGREPSSVLAVADYTAPSGAGHDLLHFRPAQTPAEQGAVAAAMLRAQLQGRAEGRRPHVVATALHGAGETAPW